MISLKVKISWKQAAQLFPLAISAVALLASIIGVESIRLSKKQSILEAIIRGVLIERASNAGSGPNIISGLALSMKSSTR